MPKKDLMDVNLVDKIRIIIKKGISFKRPLIIEGFQGVGLVGTLAAQYLAQKNKFEQIGYVDSEGIPPMAFLVNGKIMNPVKIYTNKSRNIIIIESELSIPRKIIYELSEELTKWAKKIKAKEIVCLEGLSVPESQRDYEVLGMSTSKSSMVNMAKKGVKELKNGILLGMSAVLLLKSKEKGVPGSCLMVESRAQFPDGLAAAAILEELGKIYGFNIDTSDLKNQANAFEKKMKKVIQHADQLRRIEGRTTNNDTTIYG